ncbi:OmpA family protein [Spirosoma sp. KUDC1026]|uniref:OmpA family protein n=1 Tax=Spirosoma sp. KUDC1026 TaxID=2745947 RepID=UPI00159BE0F7|nr:OmpA family protein [Spirosoma sp. KUDC1026]QKZ14215.1 OmpA family protein [Spirosoma sp. KUDC1026]
MTKWIKIFLVVSSCTFINSLPSESIGQSRIPAPAPSPADGLALLKGSILDGQTKKPLAGAVVSARSQTGTMRAQQVTTAGDGSYQLKLDPKQPYTLVTQADGYITLEEQLAFTSNFAVDMQRQPVLLYRKGTTPPVAVAKVPAPTKTPAVAQSQQLPQVTVAAPASAPVSSSSPAIPPKTLDAKVVYTPPLVVAPVGKTTQLRAIQFVQSKAELLPDAQPALEQLLAFMNSNPTTEILLAGHTDNQGDFDENVRLSKQRVDLVKEYLVKNGIAGSRITTRGYGPTRPTASNNHEASRQQNRRVEMIITKQ